MTTVRNWTSCSVNEGFLATNVVRKRYIVIAARKLDRCGIEARTPPDVAESKGLVIMHNKTTQTSRVPVPIVFPFSSKSA